MTVSRRTLLAGATGASVLALAACTPERPTPTPAPTTTAPVDPLRPVSIRRSDWTGDGFAQGATSFLPVGETPDRRDDLAAPVDDRLFFAGEATSRTAPSSLEGARESGERAAEELLALAEEGERIAVVGAGLAGAIAARRIRDAGFEVYVIEARERVGGRIRTVDGAGQQPDELGALWLREGRDDVLLAALEEAGVETEPLPRTSVRAEDRELDAGTTAEAVEVLAGSVAAAAAEVAFDLPVSGALARLAPLDETPIGEGPSPREAAALLTDALGIDTGAEARRLSARYSLDERPTGDRMLSVGGLQRYVDLLLDGIDVLQSSAVTAVQREEASLGLRLGTGESLTVDRAVLTVPLGVLKSGGITFEPELPLTNRRGIAALAVGYLETVWVRYSEPVWTESAEAWSLVPTDGGALIRTWVNLQAVTGDPVLVGVLSGAEARRFAGLGEDEAIDVVIDSLAPFLRG
ncbi:FAD-dependent oxidoreductase [Microcella daejeonensis]|uniref:flavin monoamine oxidase family protein n=1 Tax=Microcella daejeonensis TaxID=2994971 RepID=UPI0022717F38|nr:FAD-dependent oxidoreductase [Microcella daejeonensis]WAB83463.1 FAD-dependent oxidoreductase [Microcella daejeonensis]